MASREVVELDRLGSGGVLLAPVLPVEDLRAMEAEIDAEQDQMESQPYDAHP